MTWKLIFSDVPRDAPPFPFETNNFRGELHVIVSGRPPHKPASSGFVHTEDGGEYYPNIFGLKWVKETEHG